MKEIVAKRFEYPGTTSSPRAQHVPPLGSAPLVMLDGERRNLYQDYGTWAAQRGESRCPGGYMRWLEQRVWELERKGR